MALLGLAGSTAATMASWLAPILLVASLALLGRAHWVLYVLKRGTWTSAAVTWLATALVAGFWGWKLYSACT